MYLGEHWFRRLKHHHHHHLRGVHSQCHHLLAYLGLNLILLRNSVLEQHRFQRLHRLILLVHFLLVSVKWQDFVLFLQHLLRQLLLC
jgi:hypothetical protein